MTKIYFPHELLFLHEYYHYECPEDDFVDSGGGGYLCFSEHKKYADVQVLNFVGIIVEKNTESKIETTNLDYKEYTVTDLIFVEESNEKCIDTEVIIPIISNEKLPYFFSKDLKKDTRQEIYGKGLDDFLNYEYYTCPQYAKINIRFKDGKEFTEYGELPKKEYIDFISYERKVYNMKLEKIGWPYDTTNPLFSGGTKNIKPRRKRQIRKRKQTKKLRLKSKRNLKFKTKRYRKRYDYKNKP